MLMPPPAHADDEPVVMLTAPPLPTVLHPLSIRTLPLPDAPACCSDEPTHTEPLAI
jgi:hypothetical protein